MTRCAVGGCDSRAVGELYEPPTGDPSPRCRDCIALDLDGERFVSGGRR